MQKPGQVWGRWVEGAPWGTVQPEEEAWLRVPGLVKPVSQKMTFTVTAFFFFFFNWCIIALQCFTTFLRGLTSLNFTCFKLQCEGFANCVQPTIVCHQVIISGEGGLAGCWGGLLGLAVT